MIVLFFFSGSSELTVPTPEEVGRDIVRAIRNNKRKILVPDFLQTWQFALFE